MVKSVYAKDRTRQGEGAPGKRSKKREEHVGLQGDVEERRTGRFLTLVLRHRPEVACITLDREGWASLPALIEGAAACGYLLDEARLRQIAGQDPKGRFQISEDGQRIRAVQGHSAAEVARTFPAAVPPELLYHGTAERFLPGILQNGLMPRGRHFVHLSADQETARQVGRRHGTPLVLEVAARALHEEGHVFHIAENGVWLTRTVPPPFLKLAGAV